MITGIYNFYRLNNYGQAILCSVLKKEFISHPYNDCHNFLPLWDYEKNGNSVELNDKGIEFIENYKESLRADDNLLDYHLIFDAVREFGEIISNKASTDTFINYLGCDFGQAILNKYIEKGEYGWYLTDSAKDKIIENATNDVLALIEQRLEKVNAKENDAISNDEINL